MCEHNHKHEHEHTHGHSHDHDHHCSHTQAGGEEGIGEQKALLEYMIHHNEHHIEEFEEAAGEISKQGRNVAAELIKEAMTLLDNANKKLRDAVAELDKE